MPRTTIASTAPTLAPGDADDVGAGQRVAQHATGTARPTSPNATPTSTREQQPRQPQVDDDEHRVRRRPARPAPPARRRVRGRKSPTVSARRPAPADSASAERPGPTHQARCGDRRHRRREAHAGGVGPRLAGGRAGRRLTSTPPSSRRTSAMITGAPMNARRRDRLDLRRPATSRPMTSAREEQDGAEQRRVRQHPAVVRADDRRASAAPPGRRTRSGRPARSPHRRAARPRRRTTSRPGPRWPSPRATSSPSARTLRIRPGRAPARRRRPGTGANADDVEVATGQRADGPEPVLLERAAVDQQHAA